MANPYADPTNIIKGHKAAKEAFLKFPEIVREQMNEANAVTARAIQNRARLRLQNSPSIRTKTLYNAVDYKLYPKTGRAKVGISDVTAVIAGSGGSALTSRGAQRVQPRRY